MSSTLDYWPPIQEAIAVNNDASQPNSTAKVQCPICMDDIAVTSFPPVPPREGDNPDIDPTQGEVLLCGHVLCKACRTHSETVGGNRRRKCPMCRANLRCTDCGRPAKTMSIPKEGSASTVPDLAKGDNGARCADCNSKRWFNEMIQQGEWPNGLADLEPGFVPLFYHVVDKLEAEKQAITKDAITETFSNIIRSEFSDMIGKRAEAIYNRSVTTGNRWFQNTPARMMKKRTAAPDAGDEAMQSRMEHRQQLFQSLLDSYDEEIDAMPGRPLTLGETQMRQHTSRLIHIIEMERNRERFFFEDRMRRGRSGNDPAERTARARAPLFDEGDGDSPVVIPISADDFLQMLQMHRPGPNVSPGPRFAVNDMPRNDAMGVPQADMQQDDSVDIADVRPDDAINTEANELPQLVDQFDLEDGEILEHQYIARMVEVPELDE
ncbi:unnamed protein product [Fusarium equiseti]|uniref:RING-type domain-containing protein n=1 Tax=Fusarium equiseti TaxID=61235 RepID=A0A8J2IMG5_FUSEQ|nr:unnamed protein product [Fusarium equiseti]